jgi:DNA uptake protein ComE-like DNA-binding protein
VNNFGLLENSGLVDSSNWLKYFGSFEGRAFAYANVGPLNINAADKRDLQLVEGIGIERADIIVSKRSKRKFKDLDDAYAETGIPKSVLKRFKCEYYI